MGCFIKKRSNSLFLFSRHAAKSKTLLLVLLITLVGDVEVTELEGLLVGGNDAQPVADLVLLEETLGQVLEVALRELNARHNGDLVTGARDDNLVSKVVGAALDLDAVMKVLLLL